MSSLWQCGASLAALAAVLMAIQLQASLPYLLVAYVGAPLVVALLNSGMLFAVFERDIAPSPRSVRWSAMTAVAKTGML